MIVFFSLVVEVEDSALLSFKMLPLCADLWVKWVWTWVDFKCIYASNYRIFFCLSLHSI